MKLPFLTRKTEQKEYFLSLILSAGEVRSILFEKTGEALLILGTKSVSFSEPLDALSSERMIELSDVVISDVEQKVPEGGVLEKTIFVVPHRWVLEGRIVKEHLTKLKALCDALKLVPVGFIVSLEALVSYLHKKQGVPVSAIFVELTHKNVTVALVKNGTILGVYEEEVEKNPLTSVEKALAAQDVMEVLPSKIILLNFEHAKKIQQEFLGHTWPKSLAFLHIPQVEVLDPETDSQAVIAGVSSQMGFHTLPHVDVEKMSEKIEPMEVAEAEGADKEKIHEELEEAKAESQNINPEEETPETQSVSFEGNEAGFFAGVDVLKKAAADKTEPPIHEVETAQHDYAFEQQPYHKDVAEEYVEENHEPKKSLVPALGFSHLPKPSFPKISLPKFGRGGKSIFLYPILAVIFLITVIFGYYFLFEKAEVVVILDKKDISKDMKITFSQDKNTSASDSIVHVSVLSSDQSGKEQIATTGTKETGDMAKGVVTLYNKTDSPKTFDKGTTIIGPNNLEFDLDSDISVASTSAFSTSYSSTDTKVTADNFGKEYNLPSSTNFQVKGLSTDSYFAKNSQAFSGGTKKEIKVVSAADLSSLNAKIIDTLMKKAVADVSGKKSAQEDILSVPIDYTFNQKNVSNKENEAADNVNVSADITFKLGVYDKKDLASLAQGATHDQVPSGYTFSEKNSTFTVSDVAADKDNVISGKLTFQTAYLPQLTTGDIAQKIAGKNTTKADEIIQTNGVKDDQITFLRSLPLFPKILPFNKNNIVITLQSQ